MLSKDIVVKLISNYDNYENMYIGIYTKNNEKFSIIYGASELIKMANRLEPNKRELKIQNLHKAIEIVQEKFNIEIIEIN